jgi:hypothetical protein
MPRVADEVRKNAFSRRLKDKRQQSKPDAPLGKTLEEMQQAKNAHRDAMRWLGNFHTFIIGFSEEQRPQIEAWIQELKDQIEGIWTTAQH